MTTALDTEFEQIMSSDDAPKALHIVCGVCWPRPVTPGVPVAICGYQTTSDEQSPEGKRKCAKCVALDAVPLPCGH